MVTGDALGVALLDVVMLVPVSKFSRLMFFGRENVAVTKVVRVVVVADILRKLFIVQACQLVRRPFLAHHGDKVCVFFFSSDFRDGSDETSVMYNISFHYETGRSHVRIIKSTSISFV